MFKWKISRTLMNVHKGPGFNSTSLDSSKVNKRPMGHIDHLRKQFKAINTYDYIITLIKRRKKTIINFMRICWFSIWTNLNPLHPRMLCDKYDRNWLSGSAEEDFFNFVNVFSLFHNYLPLEKAGALHLNKPEFHLPRDTLW